MTQEIGFDRYSGRMVLISESRNFSRKFGPKSDHINKLFKDEDYHMSMMHKHQKEMVGDEKKDQFHKNAHDLHRQAYDAISILRTIYNNHPEN